MDDVVYVGSTDGHLRAVDARRGKLLWDARAGESVTCLRVAEGIAYAAELGHLRAFEAKTGKLLWGFEEAGTVYVAAAVDGIAYVVAEWEDRLCALKAGTGELLWDFEAEAEVGDPVVADGVTYAGSRDKHLRAFEARTGKLLWNAEAGAAICTPAIDPPPPEPTSSPVSRLPIGRLTAPRRGRTRPAQCTLTSS